MKLILSLKWKIVLPGVIFTGLLMLGNIVFTYFDINRLYFSTFQASAVSLVTITAQKIEEQVSLLGFNPSILSVATLDLKRIAERSPTYTDLMLLQEDGTIAAHNIPQKVGRKLDPEVMKKITAQGLISSIIKIDEVYYAVVPAVIQNGNPRAFFMVGTPSTSIHEKIKGAIYKQMILLVLYIALLLGIGIFYIQRSIITPVNKLILHTQQVESGDLSHDAMVHTGNEIGIFTSAYNSTVRRLKEIIVRIKGLASDINIVSEKISFKYARVMRDTDTQSKLLFDAVRSVETLVKNTEEIKSKSERLGSTSQEATTSISRISSEIQNVEENMKALSSALTNISTSVEEMNSSIKEMAINSESLAGDADEVASSIYEINTALKEVERNTEEGAALSETASLQAEEGKEKTEQTVRGMKNIHNAMEEIHEIINLLGVRSQQIGDILMVINGVAEQTNLLALNAAIIASQAGEYGKGFQVVAGEIRNLAERTSASTAEIDTLIKTAQNDAQRAIEAVEKGKASVDEGEQFSRDAAESLNKITESTNKVKQAIQKITKATSEQVEAGTRISEAANRTSENVSRIAKAVSEQAQATVYITENLDKINNFAKQTHSSTSEQVRSSKLVFKITEDVSSAHQSVSRAVSSQFTESTAILEALRKIQGIIQDNLQSITEMQEIVNTLVEKTEILEKEFNQFKFERA